MESNQDTTGPSHTTTQTQSNSSTSSSNTSKKRTPNRASSILETIALSSLFTLTVPFIAYVFLLSYFITTLYILLDKFPQLFRSLKRNLTTTSNTLIHRVQSFLETAHDVKQWVSGWGWKSVFGKSGTEYTTAVNTPDEFDRKVMREKRSRKFTDESFGSTNANTPLLEELE